MYVNGKMVSVPGIGGEEIKNSGGESSSMIYLITFKNFCKSHNVPPTTTRT
jgi:hypothetical protein